jgi:site-specific DNA recombinase
MIAAFSKTLPASMRVATYERVSSDEQRDRNTIAMQRTALDRTLEVHPDWKLVARYIDDGVSGTVPFAERPDGGRLMRDADLGLFDVVLVYDFHDHPPRSGGD